MEWIQNLISLEYVATSPVGFIRGRMQEFFRRNPSLQSLKIVGWNIYVEHSPRISMDNLTSLVLEGVPHWYLLFDLLQIKNFDGGAFTAISFSDGYGIAFTAVNSIGFSLTAAISSHEDSREDDFVRRHFSGATLVRLEDFQVILSTERLFRFFGL